MPGYAEFLEHPLLRREIEADHLGHQLVVKGKISAGMRTPRSSADCVVAYEGMSREFLRRTFGGLRRFWFASKGRLKPNFTDLSVGNARLS